MAGGELSAVAAALEQLPAEVDGVPDVELADRMRQLVRVRAMVDAALAQQLAQFDGRGAALRDGQTSTVAWSRGMLRLGTDAGALLRVGRCLDRLPLVAKAFAAGEITLEHAAAVAQLVRRVGAEPVVEFEPILLELARQAPPRQLRVACEHVRQLVDPDGDGDEAARQRRQRYLSAGRTVDGMVHLQGLLDAMSGEVVLAALSAAMPVPAEYEERTAAQRRADAVTDICAGWLGSGEAPTSGGVRPQVQVTVSLSRLQQQLQQPDRVVGDVPVLPDGQPVPVAEARRVACDAGVVPVVLGSGSEPLDVGRRSRLVPTGLRRALQLRDGGCRFAGCDRPAGWCDAHHVRHWADGGVTSLDNCLLLCAYHHTLVHEGWRLHGHPGGMVRFQRPDGVHLGLTSEPRGRLPNVSRGPAGSPGTRVPGATSPSQQPA